MLSDFRFMAHLSTKRTIPERKAHRVPNLELPRLPLFLMILLRTCRNKAANNVFDSQSADRLLTEGSVRHTSWGNTILNPDRSGRCRQRIYLAEECSS